MSYLSGNWDFQLYPEHCGEAENPGEALQYMAGVQVLILGNDITVWRDNDDGTRTFVASIHPSICTDAELAPRMVLDLGDEQSIDDAKAVLARFRFRLGS
jgi:hypothetical protein